jgi:TolB-like protein/DNA-binding winged helix-turn-helix (wHTH) protein/Tfp pilus assembly protein PilF
MGDIPMRIYEFGPFRVDPLRRVLLRETNEVRLPTKSFEILLVLLEEKGRLVEKDELMRRVWPDAVVEENNLTVNMSALRKSLGESPRDHRYLLTVPGRGYQFVADVRQHVGEPASEEEALANRRVTDVIREPEVRDRKAEFLSFSGADLGSGPAHVAAPQINGASSKFRTTSSAEYIVGEIKRHKHSTLAIFAALLVTTMLVAYFAYSRRSAGGDRTGKGSIAVLPFANKSDDPNAEYLSDGISESLINSLSELPGVKVIASSSSFQYKGKEVDFQKIASALGVEQIVTGRVVQRGDNLVINVELVNARDGTQLWGEQYNRRATDVLQVQSEISREIAEKLRLRFITGERQQLTRRESVNPQAYELLLKGRFYWRKQTIENGKNAVEYYQQAISVDPTYALAYAELSYAYSFLYGSGILDPKEFAPKAEAAVHKALELDESLADAHYALANLKQYAWEWSEAEREYQRAIELNPNLAEAHHSYSFFLLFRGRYDEAIAEAKRARELDPLSLGRSAHVARCLTVARRYDEAIEVSRKTVEMDRNFAGAHYALAGAYAGKGMYREAIAESQETIKLGGDTPTDQIYLGSFYAKAGERGKAQEILKRLQTSREYVSPGELAVLYTALGEKEQAFASLEKAYAAHDLQLGSLGADNSFDSLREDVRFKDLMRRVGLSP